MEQNTWLALGLMSGTSLDGVDLCLARFTENEDKWTFEIADAKTYPYNEEWQQRLVYREDLTVAQLLKLDHELGQYYGHLALQFFKEFNLNPKDIQLISSHGHTIYHRPEEGITLQIGNGPEIFAITGITTITDFRKQDVVMGGQGAPLVPIGDKLLFHDFDACLNLGGFANISFDKDGERVAFDICPVNFVMNPLAREMGAPYDAGGAFAKSGHPDPDLNKKLEALEYYNRPYPKSLGAEWVWEVFYPILHHFAASPKDQLRTITEHFASQIAKVLNDHQIKSCLVSGGGAYNSFLLENIRQQTDCEITLPAGEIIEYREALIFAFMGVLRASGQNNILRSVTGASHDHSSGVMYGPVSHNL